MENSCNKELLFSLSKDKGDFIVETCRCGGHGGQNVNKVETAVKIRHPASGATGECREERSQLQNRKKAFRRLLQTREFQDWHRLKTGYALRNIADFEKEMERLVAIAMDPRNLKIERYDPDLKKWVDVDECSE